MKNNRKLSGHYDGQIFDRVTSKTFRFIIIARNNEESEWRDVSWHTSLFLAQEAMTKLATLWNSLRIVPVTANEYIKQRGRL